MKLDFGLNKSSHTTYPRLITCQFDVTTLQVHFEKKGKKTPQPRSVTFVTKQQIQKWGAPIKNTGRKYNR